MSVFALNSGVVFTIQYTWIYIIVGIVLLWMFAKYMLGGRRLK